MAEGPIPEPVSEPLRILVTYPTRERCTQFLKTLYLYRTLCNDKVNTRIVVTIDANDNKRDKGGLSMADVRNKGLIWPDTKEPVEIRTHHGQGKIKAINYGVGDSEWDVCLLASDDMIPQVQGYDDLIREAFADTLDQYLWIADGRQDRISTIVCVGRPYFEGRGGNLYHPSYKSLWSDNEETEVAQRAGKIKKVPCWIKNESPQWGGNQASDPLYNRNSSHQVFTLDQKNFNRRKALGFPI